jgi:hypothetical protein
MSHIIAVEGGVDAEVKVSRTRLVLQLSSHKDSSHRVYCTLLFTERKENRKTLDTRQLWPVPVCMGDVSCN